MIQKTNMSDVELQNIYDEFFQLMAKLCVTHEPQMVTGTMMAIALRLYKTTLTPEDFTKMIDTVHRTAEHIEPFDMNSIKPNTKNLH
jgi:predicted unusual protein kinase regulating ubiquinone biosynthesis (AarF/ABC1/UbiB family)